MQELFTKRNILLGTIIILLVAVFSYVENCKDKQRAAEREECQNAIIASAEENGLQDVTVVLSKNTEYDWYEANISCSNFGDFSPKKMIAIYNGIKTPKAGDTYVVLGTVTSGADQYSIYTSSNSVYRNHDCIYAPLDVLFIVDVGRCQLHQMTNTPADQIAAALQIAVFAIGYTKDFCVSHRNGGLFADN